MILIIAGGRDYKFTKRDTDRLNCLADNHVITEVVSGGASGADSCGEQWANSRCIPVTIFKADWDSYQKYAGPQRNSRMAKHATALAVFDGGRGTEDMIKQARNYCLQIFDFRSDDDIFPSLFE